MSPHPQITVLHVLSQRPALTGSGVTLDALVRRAARAGYRQAAIVGAPGSDPNPRVGDLQDSAIYPLRFDRDPLDFPLPGMSDVMPYRSSRFSALSAEQLERYRGAWSEHIEQVMRRESPDLIHVHHLWLLASLLKDIAPEVPVVVHCHATGLRQMVLCPDLAEEVRRGVARCERFLTLHAGQSDQLVEALDVDPSRVTVVGAGFRQTFFNARERELPPRPARPAVITFAGKLSPAKGLPTLLEAVSRLAPRVEGGLVLKVAGGGAGVEAEAIRQRMGELGPLVEYEGRLDQQELASLLRRSDVLALPSFYEGLPLVLIEALACGCRLVATALPVVERELSPHLGDALTTIPLPRMRRIDSPEPADLPALTEALTEALARALDEPPLGDPAETMADRLARFTWQGVFERVEVVWREAALG